MDIIELIRQTVRRYIGFLYKRDPNLAAQLNINQDWIIEVAISHLPPEQPTDIETAVKDIETAVRNAFNQIRQHLRQVNRSRIQDDAAPSRQQQQLVTDRDGNTNYTDESVHDEFLTSLYEQAKGNHYKQK